MFRHYRQSKDLSFRELGERTGIEASALCRFENGKPLHEMQMTSLMRWLHGCVDNDKDRAVLKKAKEKA